MTVVCSCLAALLLTAFVVGAAFLRTRPDPSALEQDAVAVEDESTAEEPIVAATGVTEPQ